MSNAHADVKPKQLSVHLLDVGREKYGDCTLCQFGDVTVLIDGAHPGNRKGDERHPSIPDQLATLLGTPAPFDLSLLVVTHAHLDHIGCLPALVRDGIIKPAWALVADPVLGWGRSSVDSAPDADPRARRLVAALREEIRTDRDDRDIETFMADAEGLEARYNGMVQRLVDGGTRVVRYGIDDATPLLAKFAAIGLEIVGPSQHHLLTCAHAITELGRDFVDLSSQWVSSMPGQDAALEDVNIYRQLVSGSDMIDARGVGAAINDQSIVLRFTYGGRNLLFPGDMQFAKPEVDGLQQSMAELRATVVSAAPYDLFRIPHHGSYNAFDRDLFLELGNTSFYAISTGENSTSHPNPRVLRLLDEHRNSVDWVRTDRNGMVSVRFPATGDPVVTIKRGELDDPRPNASDVASPPPPSPVPAPVATPVPQPPALRAPAPTARTDDTGDWVEVFTRVPHTSTRVTLTIQVDPCDRERFSAQSPPADRSADLRIGGGREIPRLLFATDRETLSANIGRAEAENVLEAIRRHGHRLVDTVPPNSDVATASAAVRAALAGDPAVVGVVLLGGPDVIPLQKLDVLDPGQRREVGRSNDPDDFYVWSDDVYGCVDGDGLAEFPVTRIPDGKSASLVYGALGAGTRTHARRSSAVRNVKRPFAEKVFGRADMMVSAPATFSDPPQLDAERVYLMLHGAHEDTTRFWGEETPAHREAVNLGNVPAQHGGVVFAGCCWGALSAVLPAVATSTGTRIGGRTADESIPLAFLRAGARAFVGCTGAHYSPTIPPYNYFGAPLHQAFWSHYDGGIAPAAALFRAKTDYLAGIPHGPRSVASHAIEQKILWQYTCLGLGW